MSFLTSILRNMSKRVRSIQSEKSISRSGDFWGLSGESVLVYEFILMLAKNLKNRTTSIRDFFT